MGRVPRKDPGAACMQILTAMIAWIAAYGCRVRGTSTYIHTYTCRDALVHFCIRTRSHGYHASGPISLWSLAGLALDHFLSQERASTERKSEIENWGERGRVARRDAEIRPAFKRCLSLVERLRLRGESMWVDWYRVNQTNTDGKRGSKGGRGGEQRGEESSLSERMDTWIYGEGRLSSLN